MTTGIPVCLRVVLLALHVHAIRAQCRLAEEAALSDGMAIILLHDF